METAAIAAAKAAVGADEAKVTIGVAAKATMDWRYFLAATEEAEEEWWQQQAADRDVVQWVQTVEADAAAGEAEMVGGAMAEAKRAEVKVQAMVQAAEMQATINWRQMGAAVGDQNKISDPGGAVVQRSFHKTHFCAFCEVQGSRFKVQGSDT